jgi:hypothetical protein
MTDYYSSAIYQNYNCTTAKITTELSLKKNRLTIEHAPKS